MRNSQADRLSEEQIHALLARYRRSGDARSRDKLVQQYGNLVESIARRYSGAAEPVEDMVQEGYLGLISALDHFDEKKGVKFSTYATHFVRGAIKHYLRDKAKIIKEPAWLQELNQGMTRVMDSLSQHYGRQPSEAEIASVMEMPEEDVRQLLATREVFKVTSLDGDRDDPNSGATDIDKAKRQKYEPLQVPIEERIVLETSLQRLKEIEQRVIHEYFFQNLNQTEIANKLGISCNYVSHILRNSTKKLRKILTTEELREVQMQLRAMHRRGLPAAAQASGVTDPATQVYTRAYFLARLEEELSRATRHEYPVAVMLLTIEYMSGRMHDWAPLVVDERLYQIAEKIRDRIRKSDILARFSVNQFSLILPHTGSTAARVCERIGEIVSDINAHHPKELLSLKGTLTFATFPEQSSNYADLLAAMEQGHPVYEEAAAALAA